MAALMVAGIGLAAASSESEDKIEHSEIPEYKKLPEMPFMPGEKIIYVLRWGMFDVGSATLEFIGPVERDGEEVWQIVLNARTNAFADAIFKVRDYNAVWVDKEFTRPVYYVKEQNEGHTHHDVVVTFDWENNKAQYSDKGVARAPIDVLPGSWDPLGITYAVRNMDLTGLERISVPSTDGKKCKTTDIVVNGKTRIKTPAGRFETIHLSPDTKDLGGIFKKSKGAGISIWFTNDARHIPVRMASKVAVGSFVAEMVRVEGPGADAYNRKRKNKDVQRDGNKSSATEDSPETE